jgi:hypothetical protein
LDVEGYELQVLRGLDLMKYRPRFMLIEARDREGFESFLGVRYRPLAELSCHDVLYQATADAGEEPGTRRGCRPELRRASIAEGMQACGSYLMDSSTDNKRPAGSTGISRM